MAADNSLTHPARVGLIAAGLLAALLVGLLFSGAGSALFSRAGDAAGSGAAWTPADPAAATDDVYEPRQLVVGLRAGESARGAATYLSKVLGTAVTVSPQTPGAPRTALLDLAPGATVKQAVSLVSATRKAVASDRAGASTPITYADPNYIATAAGRFVPNDRGASGVDGGWQKLQWNFDPRAGVSAPGAWANLRADGRAGASGITIAVVDSGVAFENWHQFKRSPDFGKTKFVDPCDFVDGTDKDGKCTDTHADDRENHGTFVAGELAETTNNYRGVTGLAYGASIMPVRVLNSQGAGSETAVAAGIRYAVNHGAQVINLSLEFSGVSRADIPGVISALAYAQQQGVVVVGVAGNDGRGAIDYPAADPSVISVAGTTYDLCLAAYSDFGSGLDLAAPGGGDNAKLSQKGCNPNKTLPDVYQMTFADPGEPGKFSLPRGWFGTSMAAPEVSAAAAMVIASGVIGTDPTPKQVLDRLEATARPLGGSAPNKHYGYGLVNLDKATEPGGATTPDKPKA